MLLTELHLNTFECIIHFLDYETLVNFLSCSTFFKSLTEIETLLCLCLKLKEEYITTRITNFIRRKPKETKKRFIFTNVFDVMTEEKKLTRKIYAEVFYPYVKTDIKCLDKIIGYFEVAFKHIDTTGLSNTERLDKYSNYNDQLTPCLIEYCLARFLRKNFKEHRQNIKNLVFQTMFIFFRQNLKIFCSFEKEIK